MGRYSNLIGRLDSSGVTYIRWGRTSCPSTKGTKLLYAGRAAGGYYNHYGGGANYLCIPNKPEYLTHGNYKGSVSWLYGSEYKYPLMATHNYNVPCAVCYAAFRGEKLMIPASTTCPTSWTEEYKGYLMTESSSYRGNSAYECVDQHAENIAGTQRNTNGALFCHVVGACGAGLPCPPFVKNKVIACVVCTKWTLWRETRILKHEFVD